MLPLPRVTIIADEVKLGTIIQAFQNLSYIGEMRQRWQEIKKLLKGGLQNDISSPVNAT